MALKIFNVNWRVKTAGPSPYNNERTELFLFGCRKAVEGNPCKSCFNSALWDSSPATKEYTPEQVADNLRKFSPNRYVTIGGGEPTDQIKDLIALCKILKTMHFHIMVYTWHALKDVMNLPYTDEFKQDMLQLIQYIDILVDGEFKPEERLYNEDAEDGLTSSVGSGNQIIWDTRKTNNEDSIFLEGHAMKNIKALSINKETHNLSCLYDNNFELLTIS